MTISSRSLAITVASLLLCGTAMAQSPATATKSTTAATTTAPMAKTTPTTAATTTTTTAPATTTKKTEKPRTAASLECSKEADTKGVHGKERKAFMSTCKKAAAGRT